MATANFHYGNTTRFFVFGTNKYITQEEIDLNELPQEWLGDFDEEKTYLDFEMCVKCCKEALKELGYYEMCGAGHGTQIGLAKTIYFDIADIDFHLDIMPTIESGYYEGATFDFQTELHVAGNKYDVENDEILDWDTCDIAEEMIDAEWTQYGVGFAKMQAINIHNKIKREYKALVEELEGVFSRCCESECVQAVRFSNGETLYAKIA